MESPATIFSADAFSDYILARIARDPSLIGESPHSLSLTATSPGVSDVQRRLVHRAKTEGLFAGASVGKTSAHVGVLKAPETNEEKAGKSALVQRAVIDRPLSVLGASHLMHDVLWPVIQKTAQASRAVSLARRALAAWEATHTKETEADMTKDGSATSTTTGAVLSSSNGVLARAETEEKQASHEQALRDAVVVCEAASATARKELALAFDKVRRRVLALESYVALGDCASMPTPDGEAPPVDPSRKRPRPSEEGEEA